MAFSSGGLGYWLRRRLGISEVRREKLVLGMKRFQDIVDQVIHHRMGRIGVAILTFFVALAIIAPLLPLPGPDQSFLDSQGFIAHDLPPSWQHLFGTDQNGRDIFTRVIWGSRVSLLVGFMASVIAGVLGTLVGLVSGFWGGWRDELLMRINDILLSLPWLALLIVLAQILGGTLSLEVIILTIGLTSWNFTARVVRAQVLSVRERVFVERAKASGASGMSILRKHIFPNVFPLVFANTILTVAVAILSEATLAFLGKVQPGTLSWGVVLHEAEQSSAILNGEWAWIVMPGLALVIVILGFSLLGYALDEILNPKLRER
jgi:peptide/nickel transport system permease protein